MKEEDRMKSLNLSNNLLKKNGLIIFSFPIWDKEYNEKDNILIKSCIKLLKYFASTKKYKFFVNKKFDTPKKNNKNGYIFGVIRKIN